jgi:hypothetical protein
MGGYPCGTKVSGSAGRLFIDVLTNLDIFNYFKNLHLQNAISGI